MKDVDLKLGFLSTYMRRFFCVKYFLVQGIGIPSDLPRRRLYRRRGGYSEVSGNDALALFSLEDPRLDTGLRGVRTVDTI